jgi:hypothetical protein
MMTRIDMVPKKAESRILYYGLKLQSHSLFK